MSSAWLFKSENLGASRKTWTDEEELAEELLEELEEELRLLRVSLLARV